MKGFGIILGLVMLVIAVIVGMGFATTSLGTMDKGANVSEDYQEQYNASVDGAQSTLSIMGNVLPLVIVILAVIAGLVMMRKLL